MQSRLLALSDTQASVYRVGQRWTYRARPTEPWSTLTIVKVEALAGQDNIVHVSLDGLKLKGPRGVSSFVYHLPLTEKALTSCILQVQEQKVSLPDFRPGYDRWRKEFEAGTASVWDKPVADCLTAIENMMK